MSVFLMFLQPCRRLLCFVTSSCFCAVICSKNLTLKELTVASWHLFCRFSQCSRSLNSAVIRDFHFP